MNDYCFNPVVDTLRPSTPIHFTPVQQLQQELSDKKMLFLKNEIKLYNVIGQGKSIIECMVIVLHCVILYVPVHASTTLLCKSGVLNMS